MILAILLAVAGSGVGAQPKPGPSVECAVGAALLADLPMVVRGSPRRVLYKREGLLALCPDLVARLPASSGATDEHASDGRGVGPIQTVTIARPLITDQPWPFDARASVTLSISCPGLCGGSIEILYARRDGVWRKIGLGLQHVN